MPHAEVVGAVQHTAVRVAAAVDHVAVAFGSSHEHHGAVELFGDQGLGRFGTEVAQEDASGVAAGGVQLIHRLEHVQLVLDRGLDLNEVQLLLAALFSDGGAALLAQRDGETVAAHSHEAQFDNGDIFHKSFTS